MQWPTGMCDESQAGLLEPSDRGGGQICGINPPATPRRGASKGTAEGLWEHRFQSASSWDELAMWDSGEDQSSGGGYREPALSITVLAASRTTPTWEREHQASTWALSLTAAPLNGTTFSLSPG